MWILLDDKLNGVMVFNNNNKNFFFFLNFDFVKKKNNNKRGLTQNKVILIWLVISWNIVFVVVLSFKKP